MILHNVAGPREVFLGTGMVEQPLGKGDSAASPLVSLPYFCLLGGALLKVEKSGEETFKCYCEGLWK